MAYQAKPSWYGANPRLERPVHTSYDIWQTQNHRALRNPWERSAPLQEEEDDDWGRGDDDA
jgi:hypothetical protein